MTDHREPADTSKASSSRATAPAPRLCPRRGVFDERCSEVPSPSRLGGGSGEHRGAGIGKRRRAVTLWGPCVLAGELTVACAIGCPVARDLLYGRAGALEEWRWQLAWAAGYGRGTMIARHLAALGWARADAAIVPWSPSWLPMASSALCLRRSVRHTRTCVPWLSSTGTARSPRSRRWRRSAPPRTHTCVSAPGRALRGAGRSRASQLRRGAPLARRGERILARAGHVRRLLACRGRPTRGSATRPTRVARARPGRI